jgi:glycosyltransferase involved in cell wall biosynthesis
MENQLSRPLRANVAETVARFDVSTMEVVPWTSIPEEQLMSWQARGVVEWWGFRSDVASVLARAHIAVLPSRGGEGLPKSLLEAAACGLALIAGDVPGCRNIVRDGETGILVPPGDANALADAISRLARDAGLREVMGNNARALVEERYSERILVERMLGLYRELLGERWPGVSPGAS